jgi:menaquinone-dependent protoporphyrinogen oxidase
VTSRFAALAASLQRLLAMKILVTHGSKRGGTAEIAARIGDRLIEAGFAVDVIAAHDAPEVGSYDAVVIGGALYALRWQADARTLVLNNVAALRERQVWFFSSGPLDESASAHDIPPVPQVEELMAHVGARGHVTFGGRLAADATGMAASMAKTHAGDWRAPERIDAWARGIAEQLRADPHPARAAFKPLPSRTLAVALCLVSAVSALFGGAVLLARPDGSILGMPLSVLEHSPFHDFLVPGIVLFAVIGLGSLWATWLQARRAQNAAFASLFAGAMLAGWIIVESIMLRSFVSLQIGYLLLGLAIVGESLRQLRRIFPPGAMGPAPQPGPAAASARP